MEHFPPSIVCDEIMEIILNVDRPNSISLMSSSNCSPKVYDIINVVLDHYSTSQHFRLFYEDDHETLWFFHVLNIAHDNYYSKNVSLIGTQFKTHLKFHLQDMLLSGSEEGFENILLLFNGKVTQLIISTIDYAAGSIFDDPVFCCSISKLQGTIHSILL